MKYLKYLIDINMFETKVNDEVGYHFNVQLFTVFMLGVNYLPLGWGSKLTFFVRFFNKIDMEWAMILWKDKQTVETSVPMYDA